jgi:hypothetical protein
MQPPISSYKSYTSDSKFKKKLLGDYWWKENKTGEGDYWFRTDDFTEEVSIYYVIERNITLRWIVYYLGRTVILIPLAKFLFKLIAIKGPHLNGIVDYGHGNLGRVKDGVLICKKTFDYRKMSDDRLLSLALGHGYGDELSHVKYKDGNPNGTCKCKWRFKKL